MGPSSASPIIPWATPSLSRPPFLEAGSSRSTLPSTAKKTRLTEPSPCYLLNSGKWPKRFGWLMPPSSHRLSLRKIPDSPAKGSFFKRSILVAENIAQGETKLRKTFASLAPATECALVVGNRYLGNGHRASLP